MQQQETQQQQQKSQQQQHAVRVAQAHDILHLVADVEARFGLVSGHLADFVRLGLWQRLPSDWQTALTATSSDELLAVALGAAPPTAWPPTLLDFARQCRTLSLVRQRASDPPECPLDHMHQSGMSPKKQHEVRHLAALVADVSTRHGADLVIDVGAGKGYLSYAIADTARVRVRALERSPAVSAAGKRRGRLLTRVKAMYHLTNSVDHVATTVSRDPACLWHGVPPPQRPHAALLCGLHTCGDLGPDLLRLFIQSDHLRALVNVPCCYNLMSEPYGFPLSDVLRQRAAHLGSNARSLACKVAVTTRRSEMAASIDAFRECARRLMLKAVLKAFIEQRWGLDLASQSLGRLPSSAVTSFAAYATAALTKLGVTAAEIPCASELEHVYQPHRQREHAMSAYWVLVTMLASPIESLLLLDRWLFLAQHPMAELRLEPLFHSAISARNMVLIAVKHVGPATNV